MKPLAGEEKESMRKRFDNLLAALVLAAAVVAALVSTWLMSRPVKRTQTPPMPSPVLVAETHLELPEPTPEPLPAPTYNPSIPLSADLQGVLYEVCAEADVPVGLALGVIEVESCFQVGAVSSEGCYGLMQLNPKYFPGSLSPADNLRAGVSYLSQLLERYGDPAAALTAYNAGYDTGRRGYANAVLNAAERWQEMVEAPS